MKNTNRMKIIFKKFVLFSILCAFFILTACSKKDPQYLIEGAEDNGFVAAYRGYYALDDESLYKISGFKFDKLTLGKTNDYSTIITDIYNFKVDAASDDPLSWNYVESDYNDSQYDVDVLKSEMVLIGIDYDGEISVHIIAFDEYKIFEIDSLNNSSVLDTTYAVLKNGELLDLPQGTDLRSIRSVYKHD